MTNETELQSEFEETGGAVTTSDPAAPARPLVYRQSAWTRVTHWLWAFSLFFLLLSGLQIFNARPNLYIGQQSGFGFDNAILERVLEVLANPHIGDFVKEDGEVVRTGG